MKSIHIKEAVLAGIISGLIFLMLEMIMVPLFLEGSPWGPPRMMAAIILGKGVLPPPASFSAGILASAIVLHLILSVLYSIVIALLASRLSLIPALAVGAIIGYIMYLINFYGFTAVFPWFSNARNWVTVFAHISFGIAATWAYKGLVQGKHHQNVVGHSA